MNDILKYKNQYFEKNKIYIQKHFIVSRVKFLIDGWQSMKSTWHHGCNYNGIA
jgi:hypothetical protein